MSRRKHMLFVVLLPGAVLLASAILLEGTLRFLDATRPRNDQKYTWGVRIANNRLGFREREVDIPKPASVYRIMVLGDSLTWGVGLREPERYTALLEMRLKTFYQLHQVEVLNFASIGASTARERDILARFAPSVEPDLVIVGFCINDPQPRAMNYAVERERYAWLLRGLYALRYAFLSHTAMFATKRADRLLQVVGRIPSWPDALDRTYDLQAPEWGTFTAALADIVRETRARHLSPPLFMPLLSFDGDYSKPDTLLQRVLKWSHQAAAAAHAAGFETVNLEELFRAEGLRVRAVNAWDNHPDAECHSVYAKRLADAVAPIVRASLALPASER